VSGLLYTRYELLRRFATAASSLSLGFPLIRFFVIAAPNRNVEELSGSGIALRSTTWSGSRLGTMMAMISSGARIRRRAPAGWTRPACASARVSARVLRAKVLTPYARRCSPLCCTRRARRSAVSLSATLVMTLPRRLGAVRGARNPARPSAYDGLGRPATGGLSRCWPSSAASGSRSRAVSAPNVGAAAAVLLVVQAVTSPLDRARLELDGVDRRRGVDDRPRRAGAMGVPARHRPGVAPRNDAPHRVLA